MPVQKPILFERLGDTSNKLWFYEKVEFRNPKKGEYYLSGAIPQAYLAPNDLTIEFWIVRHTRIAQQKIIYV